VSVRRFGNDVAPFKIESASKMMCVATLGEKQIRPSVLARPTNRFEVALRERKFRSDDSGLASPHG
jgi:hypothetical protein